jgi:hypothetical protein
MGTKDWWQAKKLSSGELGFIPTTVRAWLGWLVDRVVRVRVACTSLTPSPLTPPVCLPPSSPSSSHDYVVVTWSCVRSPHRSLLNQQQRQRQRWCQNSPWQLPLLPKWLQRLYPHHCCSLQCGTMQHKMRPSSRSRKESRYVAHALFHQPWILPHNTDTTAGRLLPLFHCKFGLAREVCWKGTRAPPPHTTGGCHTYWRTSTTHFRRRPHL